MHAWPISASDLDHVVIAAADLHGERSSQAGAIGERNFPPDEAATRRQRVFPHERRFARLVLGNASEKGRGGMMEREAAAAADETGAGLGVGSVIF
jgi:hypothetical protein